jgi:hypothetical protein
MTDRIVTDRNGRKYITTEPEPRRNKPWVGLTRAEFNAATNGLEDLEDCWIAIEAKLKEKNS